LGEEVNVVSILQHADISASRTTTATRSRVEERLASGHGLPQHSRDLRERLNGNKLNDAQCQAASRTRCNRRCGLRWCDADAFDRAPSPRGGRENEPDCASANWRSQRTLRQSANAEGIVKAKAARLQNSHRQSGSASTARASTGRRVGV
jgi:hypothetical protein